MGDTLKSTNFKWLVPFEFTIRPFEIALVALPILNGMLSDVVATKIENFAPYQRFRCLCSDTRYCAALFADTNQEFFICNEQIHS